MKTITNQFRSLIFGALFILTGATAFAQAPSVTVVPTGPVLCAGTKIEAIVSNLNGPYTYLWSTGATTASINVTQTGFYRVRVTGFNGSSQPVTIRSAWSPILVIPNTNAQITANGPVALCNGQSVSLTASGGQFFSSYLWSTGSTNRTISVNTTGDYTVTVTNNFFGCNTFTSATQHVDVFDSSYVPAINANGPITVCKPGFVHLYADPGFSKYTWSTGDTTQNISVLLDGTQAPILDTMTVYLTVSLNNTCEFTNTNGLVIRSIREPKLGTNYCGNFSLKATDSIRSELVLTYLSTPQYEFEFEETTNPGTIWTYISNTRWCKLANVTPAIQSGKFYNVRVRAIVNGVAYCYGSVCQIGVTSNRPAPVSVASVLRLDGSELMTSVFPNPSNGTFNLVINNINTDETASIEVTDLSGRLINSFIYNGSTTENIQFGNDLNNGIYFVTVKQGDAKSVTRIVKTN